MRRASARGTRSQGAQSPVRPRRPVAWRRAQPAPPGEADQGAAQRFQARVAGGLRHRAARAHRVGGPARGAAVEPAGGDDDDVGGVADPGIRPQEGGHEGPVLA